MQSFGLFYMFKHGEPSNQPCVFNPPAALGSKGPTRIQFLIHVSSRFIRRKMMQLQFALLFSVFMNLFLHEEKNSCTS